MMRKMRWEGREKKRAHINKHTLTITFSVTFFTLGSRLFLIQLQINTHLRIKGFSQKIAPRPRPRPRGRFFAFGLSFHDTHIYVFPLPLDYIFRLLQRIKRKLVGEEGRCRCYERQRAKSWGNWSLSHTRWSCHGESVGSEELSLLTYTLRYVMLTDLDRHGESVASETLSLLSYTLRYVSLTDLDQTVYLCCHTHWDTSVSRT